MNEVSVERTSHYQKNAIISLLNEYLSLSCELDEIKRKQLKRDKSDSNKLDKLWRDFHRYERKCNNKKPQKNTINNQKQLCSLLKLNFEKFQQFIIHSNYPSSYNIYDIIERFIFHSMDAVKKEHAEFTKKATISKAKLERDMSLIEKRISEKFTAYELCECLNIDYQNLLSLNLSVYPLIDTLLRLKNDSSNEFSPIQPYEYSNETLADLIFCDSLCSLAISEPIKEMSIEQYIELKLDYYECEKAVVKHFCKSDYSQSL